MKIGLIGTGYWAEQCHAAGIEKRGDLDLVGVWGRDTYKAAELASRHGIRVFDDPEALFAAVDIASFAVPPAIQTDLAVAAAAAGCHLLLEKPIAISTVAADRLVDACERHGIRSIVNFSALLAGPSGMLMTTVLASDGWDGGRVEILSDLRATDTPFSQSPWRLKDDGALWDVGPHAVSMLIAALGPVADVQAHHGHGDTHILSLQHEGGAISTATVSYSMPAGASRFAVEFWGAPGLASLPSELPGAPGTPADAIAPTLEALVESIRTDIASQYDVRFGAEVVHVIAAAEAPHSEEGAAQ